MSDGDVTEGFTSITVAPDETRIPYVNGRDPTGARVTLEFSRHTPLPPDMNVRVHFDIAENGDRREIRGIPKLTHTTTARGHASAAYHYRLSHWIPALSVMRFVPITAAG
jgi:hypothetical protein